MKNSSSQSKPHVERWKFRCQQQCLTQKPMKSSGETTAVLENARPKYACVVDEKEQYTNITKIISLRKGVNMSDAAKTKQHKNGLSRNQSSIMPESYVVSSSLNLRMKNSHIIKNARRKLEIPMRPAMPHKTPAKCRGKTCRSVGHICLYCRCRRIYEDKIGR